MTRKALYKHKKTGDLFAIETDGKGNIISTSGPLLVKDLNPDELDYDNYWNKDIKKNLAFLFELFCGYLFLLNL